jgi:hypothetical protein
MDNSKFERLTDSIPTNGVKIIELYNKIDNDLLNTQPNYQRKLVWKKQHKFAFIDTILLNFPFPEIYIASSDIDIEKMIATEVVVDGQQRLTSIVEYIKGQGDFLNQKKVTSFNELDPIRKKEFLNYKVSVKDLKDIGENLIKEIFQRINSTEYSLNTVEKNNAQYGDGEIALFCKQLIEPEYTATENETDIIIEPTVKKKINDFFDTKDIFTGNDKKRMYDFQYVMLVASTILEGSYYGRSTKVDEYLEKYNSEFNDYQKIIDAILNSIEIISKLDFSTKSYWYNKANLFTLLVELSDISIGDLDLNKLERELLKLEEKVDVYFNAENEDEIKDITEDEKKYFEFARHGSHEKAARDHRGKVLRLIIEAALDKGDSENNNDLIDKNISYLQLKKISFATIIPTETGLNKSIMDAVSGVREFLKSNQINDYDKQELGPDHKIKLQCYFYSDNGKIETDMSLYRSNSRGDYRIWFTRLKTFASPDEVLALTIDGGFVNVLNLTRFDYSKIL